MTFIIIFFMFGAIIGSFLNVVIYRVPKEESIIHPGSHCPKCGTPIRFYDNIPFFGYLLLKGRCRYCGHAISPRYLLVETITAFIFATIFHLFGFGIELPVLLVFASILIVISFIDFDYYIIPDIFSLGGVILGVLASFGRPHFSFLDSLLGVILGGGILYVIAKTYELVRKREGMGGGDIKLLCMIGAFFGWKGVLFSLLTGSLIGTIVGIPMMLIKRENTSYALPFGPFLSLGAIIFIIAGNEIISRFMHVLVWT